MCAEKSRVTQEQEKIQKQLKKGGADATKPHDIQFNIYFDSRHDAMRVEDELYGLGYKSRTTQNKERELWCCMATKSIVPGNDELHQTISEVLSLAEKSNGEFGSCECVIPEPEKK